MFHQATIVLYGQRLPGLKEHTMSLIKAFKDWYYEPVATPKQTPPTPRISRAAPPTPVIVEKDFKLGDAVWLYMPLQSNRVFVVDGLNDSAGEPLNDKQQASLAKWGVCYQVHSFTSNDAYWRRPSESGVHERIMSQGMRSAPPNHFQLTTALRYKHEPLGIWLHVVLEEQVMPSSDDLKKHQLAPL